MQGIFFISMIQSKESFQAVLNADKIVITSHKSPDGDSIGSSLAMYFFLKKIGKNPIIVHPDPAPEFLHWCKGQEEIIHFEGNPDEVKNHLINAELIFCLDYNEPSRLGKEMGELLSATSAKKILIDHHLYPADFCDFVFSETEVCSTCQLVYEWIVNCGKENEIDAFIGQFIYLGIMTDTGSFRYSSVQARTHLIIASLINLGVNHTEIHQNTFDNNTIERMKLRGYALSEKLVQLPNLPVAYLSLTEDELNRFSYQKGDTEGLVNQVLSLQGIKMAVFFQQKGNEVKISFRSKDEQFVNVLANDHFSGGGHAYASGGISTLPLGETIEKFVTFVPSYII